MGPSFPTSLRVIAHYLLSLIHTCVENVFALYIEMGFFFFFYMWSIVMVLAHDSYRIKIPWFVLPWSLFNSLHTWIPLILAYKVPFQLLTHLISLNQAYMVLFKLLAHLNPINQAYKVLFQLLSHLKFHESSLQGPFSTLSTLEIPWIKLTRSFFNS